ncbi:MAG: hypothetical protein Q4C96_03640 [Planctomycetia bacterium]|nr:hypothetical protein [Planctomycetia bacterium]
MKALKVAEIPVPLPGSLARFIGWKPGYNRKVRCWVNEILNSRTEEDARKAWEKTEIEEVFWRKVTELALRNGYYHKGWIFPEDEVSILMGNRILRNMDECEWELFLEECQLFLKRDILGMFSRVDENTTFRDFILHALSLPELKSGVELPRNEWRHVILFLLLLPILAAGGYGFYFGDFIISLASMVAAFFAEFILLHIFYRLTEIFKR